MDTSLFDSLEQTLAAQGPNAAIEQLCRTLRDQKDYLNLFYALVLARRHALGLSPIPTANWDSVPPEQRQRLEDGLREVYREVGELFLKEGDVAKAWSCYRTIGEKEPVQRTLEAFTPQEGEDDSEMIQIALHEGLLPRRGFDWLLDRHSLCQAITSLSSGQLPLAPEDRHYCIERVARTLYDELRERLIIDIERRGEPTPAEAALPRGTLGVVRRLIEKRDYLFEDECYHIDTSHLSSVVLLSLDLPPGASLAIVRELCEYGKKLSPRVQYHGDPPFENQYADYAVYFATVAGEKVEEGLAHFRAKVEQSTVAEVGTAPAEVFVQLLMRLGRPEEALAVARRYLARADNQQLAYMAELCQKTNDYQTLADVAREQGNPVQFLAGLVASKERQPAR